MSEEMKTLSAFDELFGEDIRVKTEIAEQGYAITEAPLWIFDEAALKAPPRQLYRFETSKYRYYYYFEDEEMTEPRFLISVTSSIASLELLPTSKQLIEWYASFPSMKEAYQQLQRLADYGSFSHVLYAKFWRDGGVSLDHMPYLVREYKIEAQLDYDNRHWIQKANRDLIALDNWAKLHNVQPLAIEIGLAGRDGYATFVDFVCKIDIGTGANGKILKKDLKDGTIETVTSVVDWKSNMSFEKKKSFYQGHEFQLEGGRRLVEENFPNLKVDKLYNISFEGSVDAATVVMKDQTDKCHKPGVIDGRETTLFDSYWAIFKTQNPYYAYPYDITLVSGEATVVGKDTYKIGGKSPREIVVEKHRKWRR